MSDNKLPHKNINNDRNHTCRNLSGVSAPETENDKKILRDLNERQRQHSQNSSPNNPSKFDIMSISSKIKETTSVPLENDDELHLKEKIQNFSNNLSKDFDQIRIDQNKSPQAKSESLESDSGSGIQESSSRNSSNSSPKSPQTKKKSLKLESILLTTKSRKSNAVSFGNNNKAQFFVEEQSEYKKSIKGGKTIKEEDEKDIDSFRNIEKNENTEPNHEQETFKSLLKASRCSKDDSNKPHAGQKTLYSVISNFYLTKKFILLLRNSTFYRRPKWLKSNHFRMLNDWSFWEDGWSQAKVDNDFENQQIGFLQSKVQKIYQKTKENLVKLRKKTMSLCPDTFDPTSKLRMIWDILHLLVIICNMIIVPIEVGFNLQEFVNQHSFLTFFYYFSMAFFTFDIVINFNTAYYERGNLIFNRPMIIQNYLKGPLFRDLLSYLFKFLNIYYNSATMNYLDLFILLRIYNLKKIFQSIEEFMFVDESMYNTLALLKLIFGIFFLSHILACMWHFVGFIQGENADSWLLYYGILNEEWYIRYLYSYYYVVISMNTVGYGDVVAQTHLERLYCIFFIYFACWIFAYTINSIGIILQDINKMNHDYIRNINLINGYMRQKNISFDLRMRIRKYIQFIWHEEKTHADQETSSVINKLSKSLKQELLLQANGVILRELPMFNLNFSEETLKNIVYTMKEVSFIPGDNIYFANDSDDKSLYILRSGEIELYVETPRFNDPETIVKTLTKKGEIFGEYSFFSDKERETCARSSTYTSVFIIKQKDVLDIIKESSLDYQSYCQIKDQMNLYQIYDNLFQKCFFCKENQHSGIECHLMHLVLCKSRIIQKLLYSESQKRSFYQRKPIKSCNAMKNFEKHENLAQRLHQHLNSDDEDEGSDVSKDSDVNSNDTKVSGEDFPIDNQKDDENEKENLKEEDDFSPKFKNTNQDEELSLKLKENPDPTCSSKSILKGINTRTANRLNTNISNPGSSLNIPGNEHVESKKPETNNPKFLGEMSSTKVPSKMQLVAFALEYTKQNSNDSIGALSNISKKSNKERRGSKSSKDLGKRLNNKSPTASIEYSKKISSGLEEESKRRKSISSVNRLNVRENSKTPTAESKKSTDSSKESLINGILKKNEEQRETQIMTTTTENKELCLDDLLKSYDNYFPHNNVENVLKVFNQWNERKKKKKKLSRIQSKLIVSDSLRTGGNSPQLKNRRKGLQSRSNFFQKTQHGEDNIENKNIKNKNDRRKSLFDKTKIIEFLKEEEKKKLEKMGVWAKVKNTLNFMKKDEELLSKYFIKGSATVRKSQQPNERK